MAPSAGQSREWGQESRQRLSGNGASQGLALNQEHTECSPRREKKGGMEVSVLFSVALARGGNSRHVTSEI